jgi:cytoskeletal protein CcmA (bactofilin family)
MLSWNKASAKVPANAGNLSAFIDEGSEIEGKYTFSGTVMLNGRFSGEIATGDSLIIGEKGVVRANIRAGTVVVSGEVTGNIEATERVELRGSARMFGDVAAPVVVVEEGVVFEGHCRMTQRASATQATPARTTAAASSRGASAPSFSQTLPTTADSTMETSRAATT